MATAAAVAESRSELLNWANDLLQLSMTKIEQFGTGAAHCQLVDSIYGDVSMHKVKFGTSLEYEYVNNFKVLQSSFTQHGIDKYIPVDRLIKLKFQDNLEFLQWMKKFWDGNYAGGTYDAVGRRSGKASSPAAAATTKAARVAEMPGARNRAAAATTPVSAAPSLSLNNDLSTKITQLKLTIDEVEKERDFYFGKLRDIEILTQKIADQTLLKSAFYQQITEVLYKTEEGFEIPENADSAVVVRGALGKN